MTRLEVIEAKPWHVGQILRRLHPERMKAIMKLGVDRRGAHSELSQVFALSSFRRAWLLDGKLAGLCGVTGDLIDDTGYIWLAISKDALKYPILVVKEAKKQLAEIMSTRSKLSTTVISHDKTGTLFLSHFGFESVPGMKIPYGNASVGLAIRERV